MPAALRRPGFYAFLCAAVMLGTLPGLFSARTWWPWEPFRVCVLVAAIGFVLAGSRRAAVIAVIAWAFIASPLVITQAPRGFLLRSSNLPPGELLGKGVPSGPYAVYGGGVPLGLARFAKASRNYINGEGSYADANLVAWSVTLLPWPHIDRTRIIGLGGNVIDYWALPDSIEVRRINHELVISGKRYPPGINETYPELRALVWARTRSAITVAGWLLLALAIGYRILRRNAAEGDPLRPN
jgi:hypothetical protein